MPNTYGQIVLVNTKKGFIPSAIKWFTGSKFSHSLVIMPDMFDTRLCIEAVEGGVNMVGFDTEYSKNQNVGYEVYSINVDQKSMDKALELLIKDLEIGYGFLAYPWFIYRRIGTFFGIDMKKHDNWFHSGIICSQLCTYYLQQCGLSDLFADYGDGSVSPQDLKTIIISRPDIFKLTDSVRM